MAGAGKHHDRYVHGRARLYRCQHRAACYYGDARCEYQYGGMGVDGLYAGHRQYPSGCRLALRPLRV